MKKFFLLFIILFLFKIVFCQNINSNYPWILKDKYGDINKGICIITYFYGEHKTKCKKTIKNFNYRNSFVNIDTLREYGKYFFDFETMTLTHLDKNRSVNIENIKKIKFVDVSSDKREGIFYIKTKKENKCRNFYYINTYNNSLTIFSKKNKESRKKLKYYFNCGRNYKTDD